MYPKERKPKAVEFYKTHKCTIYKAARMANVHPTSLGKWLKELGIKTYTREERLGIRKVVRPQSPYPQTPLEYRYMLNE